MDEMSDLDRAFEKLIGKGEQLLAAGRPGRSFESMKEVPERIEADLEQLQEAGHGSALLRLNPGPLQSMYDELKRFATGRLVFSAMEPGQGTSFIALNIARLWAAQDNRRVLYLELFTGEACMDDIYARTSAQELSDDPSKLEDCLYALPVEGQAYYLPLKASGRAAFWSGKLLERIEKTFDVVVIDCAPLIQNPLFSGAAGWADGVALVACREPDNDQVARAAEEITSSGGHFLGVVLNEPGRTGETN